MKSWEKERKFIKKCESLGCGDISRGRLCVCQGEMRFDGAAWLMMARVVRDG